MKLSEIASLAGVSTATVSRVLNNKGKVSAEVQKRIMDVVAEYNYIPNATGRSLRTSKTGVLMITMPDLSNPFYRRLIEGALHRANDYGYNIILAPIQMPSLIQDQETFHAQLAAAHEAEQKYVSMLSMKQVDGIISLGSFFSEEDVLALNRSYPLVFACECPITGTPLSCAEIDNRMAAFDAVNALAKMGHTRIGMVSFRYTCNSSTLREQGYQLALAANGLPYSEEYVQKAAYNYEGGYESCQTLFALPEPPTAIFCYNDRIAIGVIRYLTEHGLQPGKDVDVIGFDDTEIAANYLPSITSVSHPAYDIGTTAVDLLMEKIKDLNATAKKVTLPHSIHFRDTTRPF